MVNPPASKNAHGMKIFLPAWDYAACLFSNIRICDPPFSIRQYESMFTHPTLQNCKLWLIYITSWENINTQFVNPAQNLS